MDTEYIDYEALDGSDFEDYDPYYDDPTAGTEEDRW